MEEKITLSPQPGQQTKFLSTSADIAIYGGAAGGGKTYSLLFEPLRHIHNNGFSGVIFRREIPQIMNPGGMWDEAINLYASMGAAPNRSSHQFHFQTGSKIKFSHLEQESSVFAWQGSQIPYIGFDELTHFTKTQFFYMISRNRSTSGVKGYIRGTTNPDPDSWVKEFIGWWIGEDGYPIPERDGIIRWFTRDGDKLIWSDTKDSDHAKSVTFIAATLEDNQILMQKDPGYVSNLESLPYVERMRLRKGNWNVRATAGNMFRRDWFEIVDAIPAKTESVRYWDRASSENEDAAWTAGVKMHRAQNGLYFIEDVCRFRGRPLRVEESIKNMAIADGWLSKVGIEQDPGQAGVSEAEAYGRLLSGFDVKIVRVSTDKVTRAKPLSAQCERGNVKLLRGQWNKDFLEELEGFPEVKYKDQVDASSGAFNLLAGVNVGEFTKAMSAGRIKSIVGSMKGEQW